MAIGLNVGSEPLGEGLASPYVGLDFVYQRAGIREGSGNVVYALADRSSAATSLDEFVGYPQHRSPQGSLPYRARTYLGWTGVPAGLRGELGTLVEASSSSS